MFFTYYYDSNHHLACRLIGERFSLFFFFPPYFIQASNLIGGQKSKPNHVMFLKTGIHFCCIWSKIKLLIVSCKALHNAESSVSLTSSPFTHHIAHSCLVTLKFFS